jgi:hypothetical protein
MVRLHERVIFANAMLEVFFEDPSSFLLRYGDLVAYRPGEREVQGRTSPYRFRSVEQLRYDFERDVEGA